MHTTKNEKLTEITVMLSLKYKCRQIEQAFQLLSGYFFCLFTAILLSFCGYYYYYYVLPCKKNALWQTLFSDFDKLGCLHNAEVKITKDFLKNCYVNRNECILRKTNSKIKK